MTIEHVSKQIPISDNYRVNYVEYTQGRRKDIRFQVIKCE